MQIHVRRCITYMFAGITGDNNAVGGEYSGMGYTG